MPCLEVAVPEETLAMQRSLEVGTRLMKVHLIPQQLPRHVHNGRGTKNARHGWSDFGTMDGEDGPQMSRSFLQHGDPQTTLISRANKHIGRMEQARALVQPQSGQVPPHLADKVARFRHLCVLVVRLVSVCISFSLRLIKQAT